MEFCFICSAYDPGYVYCNGMAHNIYLLSVPIVTCFFFSMCDPGYVYCNGTAHVYLLCVTIVTCFICSVCDPGYVYCNGTAQVYLLSVSVSIVTCFICSVCDSGYVYCNGTARCIPESWICDLDNDCGDMEDEQACGCKLNKFNALAFLLRVYTFFTKQ